MKVGICAWVLPPPVLESFELAKDLGFDGLVIDFDEGLRGEGNLASSVVGEHYSETALKYSLEIPTMALNCLCIKGMTNIANKAYAQELIHRSIEVSAAMGIKKIQVPSFGDNLIRTEADMSQTIEMFKYACEIGSKNQVLVGSESVMTIDQHKQLYDGVKSEALTTLFDTQNPWRMMNQDGIRLAEYMAPYVGELHAKDSYDNGPITLQLGQGDVKYKEIMKVFVEAGFDQWVQFESRYNEMVDYPTLIREDLRQLRQLFGKKS